MYECDWKLSLIILYYVGLLQCTDWLVSDVGIILSFLQHDKSILFILGFLSDVLYFEFRHLRNITAYLNFFDFKIFGILR